MGYTLPQDIILLLNPIITLLITLNYRLTVSGTDVYFIMRFQLGHKTPFERKEWHITAQYKISAHVHSVERN